MQSVSYALFPSMEKCVAVDWQCLVTEDEQAENIRLHELEQGQNLPQLLKYFKENWAKAVVLINTTDEYELAEEFVCGDLPCPVVVVKRSDGEEMVRFLERQPTDMVYARVDAENQVDEVDQQTPVATAAPQGKDSVESSISEFPCTCLCVMSVCVCVCTYISIWSEVKGQIWHAVQASD